MSQPSVASSAGQAHPDPDDHCDAPSPYAQLGGEPRVRALVDRFYDLMDVDARFADVRRMHPASLDASRDKLHWFLCGWLGGPQLYVERRGHPRLRARHLPFAIDTVARDQWLACMLQAMIEINVEEPLRERLLLSLYDTADWMRNRAG